MCWNWPRQPSLPLHFIHGRPLLSTADGQLTAALAEILLRGFSRSRVVRFVDLLRSQCERFESLPGDWVAGPAGGGTAVGCNPLVESNS